MSYLDKKLEELQKQSRVTEPVKKRRRARKIWFKKARTRGSTLKAKGYREIKMKYFDWAPIVDNVWYVKEDIEGLR
jgi:hypothetical protein